MSALKTTANIPDYLTESEGRGLLPMLSFTNVSFRYPGSETAALTDVSFSVEPGSYVVLLGANGSGKSTLAHLANGLLEPSSGEVSADGLISSNDESLWNLRQRVGLVAQDPDEQIVSTTVLDEVAFGPENLGIDPAEIALRVKQSLAAVGLSGLAERDPNTLSGGQKQRLVLAAILAMQPRYLVLDEPTSMLDALAVQEFIGIIERLRQSGQGILHITHDLGFAADADLAVVLDRGEVVYQGDPKILLLDQPSLQKWKLDVPLDDPVKTTKPLLQSEGETLELKEVHFGYAGLSQPVSVLDGLSLALIPGSYTLISGASGAGKSTLLRLATGLLKPDQGEIGFINQTLIGEFIFNPITPGQVGLVFQHPEDQLFASTVAEDIAFGPRNLGLLPHRKTDRSKKKSQVDEPASQQEANLVAWALQSVGLDPDAFASRSPFLLSGGEMRRVAIAGILAMQPRWLLFDEPTAGLDASGRAFMHRLINAQLEQGNAVVVVSHSVDEFASRCQQHFRLDGGRLWPA